MVQTSVTTGRLILIKGLKLTLEIWRRNDSLDNHFFGGLLSTWAASKQEAPWRLKTTWSQWDFPTSSDYKKQKITRETFLSFQAIASSDCQWEHSKGRLTCNLTVNILVSYLGNQSLELSACNWTAITFKASFRPQRVDRIYLHYMNLLHMINMLT